MFATFYINWKILLNVFFYFIRNHNVFAKKSHCKMNINRQVNKLGLSSSLITMNIHCTVIMIMIIVQKCIWISVRQSQRKVSIGLFTIQIRNAFGETFMRKSKTSWSIGSVLSGKKGQRQYNNKWGVYAYNADACWTWFGLGKGEGKLTSMKPQTGFFCWHFWQSVLVCYSIRVLYALSTWNSAS